MQAASDLADRLTARELEELALSTESAVAGPDAQSAGISALTGNPLPSGAEVATARLRNVELAFAERRRLLADTITVSEVSGLLGVARQTPHDRLAAQALLAVKDRGHWRFPLWQFDADGPNGALAGLADVLRALRGPISELGRLRWFETPKQSLGGRTPVEVLRAGDVDAVLEAAQALGAS